MTLIEVLAGLAVLGLLLAIVVPGCSGGRERRGSRGFRCGNNLRQITLGASLFAQDREGKFPWEVPTARTGTLELVESPQVFRHFSVMSNELATPNILVCPMDKRRFVSPKLGTLANQNISYFVNVATRFDTNSSAALMLGDRNITGGTLSNGFLRLLSSTNGLGWSKELHQHFGYIGRTDGSVSSTTTQALHEIVRTSVIPLRLAMP